MTKFAAHDRDVIYGIGGTPADAIANAVGYISATDPKDLSYRTSPIRDEFAAWIEANGWDGMTRSFDVDRSTGFLIDTTDQRK